MHKGAIMNSIKQLVLSSFTMLSLASASVFAQEASTELTLDNKDTIINVLKNHIGENVYIHTEGGKEINGKLQFIGAKVIQVSRVAGRDYYDAVIDIDHIETAMIRVRGKQ